MNFFQTVVSLSILSLFIGCASGSKITDTDRERQASINQKAYDHFFNGALLDFQDEYDKALIEYYQALLYDSTSAQILKAIARNLIRLQYYESAAKTLEKSFRFNPGDEETLNYLAEAYYNLQNFQKSIYYYKKLLSLDPYNSSTQNNIIFLYSHLKMDEELRQFYQQMMTYYPDDPHYAIQYALASIRQKEVEEAQRVLESIIRKDPTQMDALNILGNLYEIRKDTLNAIRIYEGLLHADPSNDEAVSRLYRIYRDRGQWPQMEKLFSSILVQSPTSPQIRLMLAETYYFQDKKDQARQVIAPVIEDEQFRPAAFELMGRMAFEEQNLADAEKYFLSLTETNPDNRFGWLFLGVIYNQQSNFEKSIKILQRSLDLHPEDPDLLALYGTTLSQLGRDRDAIKPLEKARQIDQDNMGTLSSMAAVYDKLQMWDKSDSLYTLALEKAPDNALLLNNYSYSLTQRDLHLDKALEMVNQALEIDPENGAYLDTKGWIMYKLGQYQEALNFIQKAIESREESAEVLEHLGDVYLRLDQPDKAREYWQKALEKDPTNTNLAQKIQGL